MTKSFPILFGIVALAGLVEVAQASAFRGGGPRAHLDHMSVAALSSSMLDELMSALGGGNRVTAQRLEAIEETLRPIFKSLPKNTYGNLEHAAVRYVLHRLFVVRHGMYVKGLEPGGEAWNETASPTEVLDDKVPAYVQTMFERRLNGRGLGMRDIAILAATLEHLIHDEAVNRLKVAYAVQSISVDSQLSKEKVEEVIDTYMVLFLLGINESSTIDDIMAEQDEILETYPQWPESQQFTHEVQKSVAIANKGSAEFANNMYTFNATAQVVEEIGERFGRWQDSECRDLKSVLMKLEVPGTGRVLLKDFYGGALDGSWQFTESVAYLKELGALDDRDPDRKSVILANYVNSPSNCLSSSSIYSVCCFNECEALLGHLEREIGEPDASGERILELVAALPSSTVQAPRSISSELRSLLGEVAVQNHGRIPLHGRLFGQWMHHAYPRECPYPHKAGTTRPMTADEWVDENGEDALYSSDDEMEYHVTYGADDNMTLSELENANGTAALGKSLMWTAEEELVVSTPSASERNNSGWSRGAMLAIVASLCIGILRTFWPAMVGALNGKEILPTTQKPKYC